MMDDLISRQAAIDNMTRVIWGYPNEIYPLLNDLTLALGLAKDGLMGVPSVDAVEVVRCKDCKYRPISYGDEHDLCFPKEYHCPCQCDDNWYSWMPKDDFFCARGERKTDG